jgi:hypothetical protein
MSFKERFRHILHMTDSYELNVLVWGPGEGSSEHYEKRLKIQRELRSCFRNADVTFSENLNLSEVVPGAEELSIPEQELWHLKACDICVVLDTSKGAGEEIAHFVASHLAYKLLILTHERYRDSTSFPAALRKYENQIFYSDEEYDSCSLVAHVLARARTVALCKLEGKLA